MSSKYDFTEEEYQGLRSQLNSQELEEIEKLEKGCADLTMDYWEFYRRVENYRIGICWTAEKFHKLLDTPMYKLRICLLHRAGGLRGIKFG